MDHDHALQFLAALFSLGAATWVGYQFGKDREQDRCNDALLGLGLEAVASQIQSPAYQEVPWGVRSVGCGCGT